MKSVENSMQQQGSTADRQFPYQRGWGGNAHNTALAEVAAVEDQDPDGFLVEYHTIELANAPMFALLLELYREQARGASGYFTGDDVALSMLAARLFMAGQRSRDRGDIVLGPPTK